MVLTKKELAAVTVAKASKADEARLKRVWPDVHWALRALRDKVRNPIVKITIESVLALATGLLGEPQLNT